MKNLLCLAIALTSFASYAVCPNGTTELLNCKSTPVSGDNQIVSQIADAVGVCQSGKTIQLALVANGAGGVENAKISRVSGATIYALADGQESPFVFIVESRTLGKGARMAKLSAQLGDGIASSTFTCH
jgi:hypothetical protein